MLAAAFTSKDALMLVAILLLLVMLSFFAVAEMGLSRISKPRAETLAQSKTKSSRALVGLVERPERWVNPILLSVNICQIVQATLTAIVAGSLFGAWGVVVGVVLNVLVFFVLTEAVPKTYAVLHPERAALLTARPTSVLVSFAPLRMVSKALISFTNVIIPGKGLAQGPFVSERELLSIVETAAEDEVIEHEERELIESIIEFGDTVAHEVMVPRPDMITFDTGMAVKDALDIAIEHGLSRVPILQQSDGNEDVLGLAYLKDLIKVERAGGGDQPIDPLARPVRYIPENKPVARLMREMQAEKFHLAVVADEYGGIAGLITLEDCLEELVGEIVDEYDKERPDVEVVGDGEYLVDGGMGINDLNDLLDVDLPDDDWDTVGGWVFGALEHVPAQGESVRFDGWRFTVEQVEGRRIRRGARPARHAGIRRACPGRRRRARRARRAQLRCRQRRRRQHGRGLMRSGFVTFAGRPNVGKSTLLNAICGEKVSIVSDKPQTTRFAVRGVLNKPDLQLVFVDTPGIHKPVTALGERVNATALDSLDGVDVACLVVDATMPFGTGDRWVAERLPNDFVVVLNKVDAASHGRVAQQLSALSELPASAFFPVSARTGEGVDTLVEHLASLLPEGPAWFPTDSVTDMDGEQWVAELVREQLLAVMDEELPYSIATRVTEWEDRRIRVEILVERESQKGMVIGKKGAVLKEVGTRVREQLPKGTFLELFVKVDKDWQRRPDRIERLGY